jgi:hypothetical protein
LNGVFRLSTPERAGRSAAAAFSAAAKATIQGSPAPSEISQDGSVVLLEVPQSASQELSSPHRPQLRGRLDDQRGALCSENQEEPHASQASDASLPSNRHDMDRPGLEPDDHRHHERSLHNHHQLRLQQHQPQRRRRLLLQEEEPSHFSLHQRRQLHSPTPQHQSPLSSSQVENSSDNDHGNLSGSPLLLPVAPPSGVSSPAARSPLPLVRRALPGAPGGRAFLPVPTSKVNVSPGRSPKRARQHEAAQP